MVLWLYMAKWFMWLSGFMWLKVAKSVEKWRKVAKSWERVGETVGNFVLAAIVVSATPIQYPFFFFSFCNIV